MTHDPLRPDPDLPQADPYPAESRGYGAGWVWGLLGLVAVLAIVGMVMWGGAVNEGEQTASTDRVSPPASAPAAPGASNTQTGAAPATQRETVGGQ